MSISKAGILLTSQDPPVKDIRHQLLTATAGAVFEAERRDCDRALLLVHEFVTNRTTDAKHARTPAAPDVWFSFDVRTCNRNDFHHLSTPSALLLCTNFSRTTNPDIE